MISSILSILGARAFNFQFSGGEVKGILQAAAPRYVFATCRQNDCLPFAESRGECKIADGYGSRICDKRMRRPRKPLCLPVYVKKPPHASAYGGYYFIRPAGIEPATNGLEIRCSIQLSYGRIFQRNYAEKNGRGDRI
jgi:hypothetical protein